MILASFYIGYVITHVPGGILAEKFGGKYTLSLGILSTAIFTLLTPFAVDYGMWMWGALCVCVSIISKYSIADYACDDLNQYGFYWTAYLNGFYTLGGYVALIILRILMGLGEGTTFPALSVLLASWVPMKERSKTGSFVFGGGQVSTFPLSD